MLYFTRQTNHKNHFLFFNLTKNYKAYVSSYHYDNFSKKFIMYKLNLAMIKLNNFKLFIKYFNDSFVLINQNF